MCSPVPTSLLKHTSSFSFSFYSFYLSVSVYLLFCQPLHPPTYSSLVPLPQPLFLSAAMLPCLPLGKEMRQGTDANILDPLLLPDSSPRDRNKDGVRKRGGMGGRKRWRGTAITEKNRHTQNIQLIGTQWKNNKSGYHCEGRVYYHAESFLQQQREHKPPNTVHYFSYSLSTLLFCGVAVLSFSLQCYFSSSEGSFLFSASCLVYLLLTWLFCRLFL